MAYSDTPAGSVQDGPVGIGGWLILPIIGLVLTPLRMVLQVGTYTDFIDAFPQLTVSQQLMILFEIAGNLVIGIVLPVILLILLANKKRLFPRLYVFWGIGNLIFLIVDLLAAYLVFREAFEASGEPFFDSETVRAIGSSVVLAAIWVPYMLQSRRVRNTFVN